MHYIFVELLANLVKDLIEVQHKYLPFGVQLGVPLDKIKTFEKNFGYECDETFVHIFDYFLNNFATDVWFTRICDALEVVDRKDLAAMVTEKYIAPRGNIVWLIVV